MSEAETFQSQGIKDLLGHILPAEKNGSPDYLTQDIARACQAVINEKPKDITVITRDKSGPNKGEKADRLARNEALETAMKNFEGAVIARLEFFPTTAEIRKRVAHSLIVNHTWWYIRPDASQTS